MLDTTEERLDLLRNSKEDIKNAINNKLQNQNIVMPTDTPLSEYDVYIKMIQGGEFARVNSIADLSTIDNPKDGDLAIVYDKEHNSGFAGVYIYQNSYWVPVPNIYNATANKMLVGTTALGANGNIEGTMPNNGALNYTPSTQNQNIPAGYTTGGTVSGDADLVNSNIKAGANIFGVNGKVTVVDTEDATALANDIISPKTAYINGAKVLGTITSETRDVGLYLNHSTYTISNTLRDYRADIGYALDISGGIRIFKIDPTDGSLTQVDSVTSGWSYNLNDAKFAPAPFYEDDEHCLYNIYCAINGSSHSVVRSDFYRGCFVIRFDTKTGQVYSDSTYSRTLNWSELAARGYNPNGTTCATHVRPLTATKCLVIQSRPGGTNNEGAMSIGACLITANNTSITKNMDANQMINRAYGLSDASSNGLLYITYASNGEYGLYRFPNTAYSSIQTISTGNRATHDPILLDDKYILNNKLYNQDGTLILDYEQSPFHNAANFKFYINGFILEMDAASRSIFKYSFNLLTYEITFETTLNEASYASISYGNTSLKDFPIKTISELTTFNSNTQLYQNLISSSSGQQLITKLIRDGISYQFLEQANLVSGANLLRGSTAYGSNGRVIGTMPNNGQLSYTPSESAQTIPAGYTSGGTISAFDWTTATEYQTCLALTNEILE